MSLKEVEKNLNLLQIKNQENLKLLNDNIKIDYVVNCINIPILL